MEITLLIMKNHGIVFLNFCENPVCNGMIDKVVDTITKNDIMLTTLLNISSCYYM